MKNARVSGRIFYMRGEIMGEKKTVQEMSTTYANSSLLGHRYVFFSSLWEDNKALAQAATAHFNKVSNNFKKTQLKDDKQQDYLDYMKSYLGLIQQLIQNEKQAEGQYLQNLLDTIKNKEDLLPKTIIEEFEKFLKPNINSSSIEYSKILGLLNKLKTGDDYLKYIEQQINNIKLYQYNLVKFREEWQISKEECIKEMQEFFILDHKGFNQIFGELMKNVKNETQTSYIFKKKSSPLENIKKLIDNNIFILQNSRVLKDALRNIIESNHLDELSIKKLIVTLSIQNIDLSKELNDKKTPEEFEKIFKTHITQANIENILPKSNEIKSIINNYESLEQQALENGTQLAERISRAGNEGQQYLKEHLGQKGLDIWERMQIAIDNGNIKSARSIKGQITKLLRREVEERRNAATSALQETSIDLKNQFFLNEINANTKINVTDIMNCLNMDISLPSLAEIMGAPEIREGIINLTGSSLSSHSYAGGTTIQYKNDIMITWSWKDDELQKLLQKNGEITENSINFFLSQAYSVYQNFLKRYNKNAQQNTDVFEAASAYLDEMESLAKIYQELYNQLKNDEVAREALVKYINNLIFEGITVKQYDIYDPNIGFKGGSLGGSGRVIDAVPNILAMYNIGGINVIEADAIIEALLNCGPGQMAPGDLVENFKNYLIGGAALMLFDDGFANAKEFLEEMKKLFFQTSGPRQVHLLLLNGTYYLFSFMLQQIYNNLSSIYQDIVEKTSDPENIITQNYLYVANNITLPTSWDSDTTAAQRWNYISQQAQDNVTITFMFMGGILDILQKIADAF